MFTADGLEVSMFFIEDTTTQIVPCRTGIYDSASTVNRVNLPFTLILARMFALELVSSCMQQAYAHRKLAQERTANEGKAMTGSWIYIGS